MSQTAELMVAEALSRDLIDQNSNKEDNNLKNKNTSATVEPQAVEPQAVEPQAEPQVEPVAEPVSEPAQVVEPVADPQTEPVSAESDPITESTAEPDPSTSEMEPTKSDDDPDLVVSSLTPWDIQDKIRKAVSEMIDGWFYVSFLFPEEHKALLKVDGSDELSFKQVSYSVSDDEVTISDLVDVKLTVSVAQINEKFGEMADTIASLNEQVNTLKAEVETLTPFREAAEQAAHDEKEAQLRAYAENSQQFTEEEMLSEEMSKIFSELDESTLKIMVADRVVAAQAANQLQASVVAQHQQLSNTANLTVNEPSIDAASVMRAFLKH